MREKKDIFNGKIKKEYFLYILTYLIFIPLVMLVVGGMALGVGIWVNAGFMFDIIIMRILGVIFIALGIAYVVGCMLVIRKYPKHEKLRRILYNSDCYFTESDSNEYRGTIRGIRGRGNKAAFDLVTTFAEAEKRMGEKKPIRYTVYSALTAFVSVLGLVILIVVPLLFENGTVFPNMSEDAFLLCYILGAGVCIALIVFFLVRALRAATMATCLNNKWQYELYTSLGDIAARKNNKKLKFWYKRDQIEQIEKMVKAASQNAEWKLEMKANKPVSFKVIDIMNNRLVFTGYFL